jgi:site-specific DNA recombinase
MKNSDDDPKRVGIWIRVSTEDQVRGESPETHERRARAYAESRDWNIVEVYRLDAISGKTVKDHPEAKRMLADIQAGHITGLIFSKLARLARNTKELLEFADVFKASGADLISLAEAIDTSTPAGRLFYTMIAAMAQWEREEIAARVSASVPIRAQMGKPIGGAAPFGYRWVGKELKLDPTEAPVRKLMFELFKEHRRKKTVANTLNERGYRTRTGAKFSDTTVDRLLRDPVAKGTRRSNYTSSTNNKKAWKLKAESDWVLTAAEPVVSEELWTEVNTLLDERRASGKRQTKRVSYLFSGLTFCACQGVMYVPSNMPKYTCRECRNKIPIGDLEHIFKEELRSFVFSPAEIASYTESGNVQLSALETLVRTLEAEHKKVTGDADKLIELYQANVLDKKGFGDRYGRLKERLHQLDAELPQAQAKRDVLRISLLSREEVLTRSKELVDRWDGLPQDEKRHIVETIVSRVVIGDGEVEFEFLYNPGSAPTGQNNPSASGSGNTGIGGLLATQRHGFMAAISWKRAGNSDCLAALEMTMRPVSNGSRKASKALRGYSASSSRNRTPS